MKEIEVIINGSVVKLKEEIKNFAQIIELAGFKGEDDIVYTVTYEQRGNTGSIIRGDTLKIKEGTIINITRT